MGLGFAAISFLLIFATLLLSSLPFISAFVAVRLARRVNGKVWLWGVVAFVVVSAVEIFNYPYLLAGVTVAEFEVLTIAFGKHEETIFVSLKDANKVVMKQTVKDISFDVPLTYMRGQYYPPAHGWQNVTKRQYEGSTREARSFIEATALLPDLEPMSEMNYKLFEAANGKEGAQVQAMLTTQPSTPTDYYFRNSFSRLQRQPEDPSVPGMLHYYESLGVNGKDNIYFSHDHVSPEFTEIRCRESIPETVNPTCNVTTYFDYKGYHFGMAYSFAPAHLRQWREIGGKVKVLFEHFGDSAQRDS